jgi:integrase
LERGERLMEACDLQFRPLVEWAIETALRRREILGLQQRDIRGRVAFLRETKNGKPRAVPLSSKALLLTEAIPFPFSPDQVRRRWIRACREAGIANLHFHDLRHEATSRLFEKGLSHFEVMAVTGHSSTQMLRRYCHFRPEELAKKLG